MNPPRIQIMRMTLSIILGLLAIVSCGRDKDSSGKKTVPLVPERMEEILDRQSFRCQSRSGGGCPLGMARLFILNPEDPSTSAVCSGFMVTATRLVTNHHCVSSQRACNNTYISVHTSTGPVKGRCREMIFSDANSDVASERSVDLTVMELDTAVPPPYFDISPTRQTPGKLVTAWVIDHVDLLRANITELTCDYDAKEASMLLKDCPAISGNSGSPVVLRGTTDAFGILWGSTIPPSIDASFPMEMRLDLKALSLATELYPFRSIISGAESNLR